MVSISTTEPMELLAIDFLSLERGKGGFENILVVTDSFTKYSWAFPMRNQKASRLPRCFYFHMKSTCIETSNVCCFSDMGISIYAMIHPGRKRRMYGTCTVLLRATEFLQLIQWHMRERFFPFFTHEHNGVFVLVLLYF